MAELTQVEDWSGALLAKLAAPQRRALARAIALDLRRANQRRIAAQIAPDGTPYPARKPQRLRGKAGAIRRRKGAMFAKLRLARWLRTNATDQAAEVGFYGRVARLARVHQEGDVDRARPDAKPVRYARRQLLGFADADRRAIRDRLLTHLGGR